MSLYESWMFRGVGVGAPTRLGGQAKVGCRTSRLEVLLARGPARLELVCGLALLLTACGGAAPPPTHSLASDDDALLRDPVLDEVLAEEKARRAHTESRSAKTAPHAQREPATRTASVRGITGSLNAFEVEQAMSARSAQLLACVAERPHALGHVAGDIAFHLEVAGSGKVERVSVMESDIGYAPLEACLSGVVATAPLPAPAGAERAETQWRMSVDPLRQAAEPLDSAVLEETIARQSDATYERCEIAKGRHFVVNGYLRQGQLQPVSVRAPWRGPRHAQDDSGEQLTCLSDALLQWTHWPKASGFAKVSFELRWVEAPPPPRQRGRRKH
jgi:hypothetical protein